MNTKTCKTCGIEYPKTSESFNRNGKYFRSYCKACEKIKNQKHYQSNKEKINKRNRENYQVNREKTLERQREHYQNNKEKIRERQLEHYHNNKEAIRERRKGNKEEISEYNKEYSSRPENKKRRNERLRKRLEEDPVFKLRCGISRDINRALRKSGGQKDGPSWDYLPYSPDELKVHLETHDEWEDWMTWDDYGNGPNCWNIDHIIPQSLLPFDSYEHPNFLKCWKLENLRPLCAIKNIKKSNRVDSPLVVC